MKKIITISVIFSCLCYLSYAYAMKSSGEEGRDMKLKSPAFENNQYMPVKTSCEGQGINPALIIEDMPKDTKSLALIVDDPDAPRGTWVHWVVFDIPPVLAIKENSVPGKLGINDSNPDGKYGPACPPSGTHRYFFKVYALDSELNLGQGADKAGLEKAMEGHILGKAELVGLYKRSRR